MEIPVLIAPVAAIAIRAEHGAGSSSHCANRATDNGSHWTAHGGSGHRAARCPDSLRRSSASAQGKGRERDKCDLVHDGDLVHPMRLQKRGNDAFVPSVRAVTPSHFPATRCLVGRAAGRAEPMAPAAVRPLDATSGFLWMKFW
jgi:hypothetical protein